MEYKEEERDGDNEKKGEECNQASSSRLTGIFVSGSVVSLTEDQIKLPSRGLMVSPTPRDIDKNQLKLDINNF